MTVLITGANRGIGRGLLDHYRAAGRAALGTARAPEGDLLPLDVTEPASHAGLAARLAGRPIDLLVCNAGVFLDRGHRIGAGLPAELWERTFAVNVTGVFLTVETVLPNLRAAGGAKIAILSSQMGSHTRAPGGSYIYRASKAAVLNLGRNLATDLRREGIAVGVYHPGSVRTDMGGPGADIGVDTAVTGLAARFAALSPETTGVFENWDGSPMPF